MKRLLLALGLLTILSACTSDEEKARMKIEQAFAVLDSNGYHKAANLADEAVKLDSTPYNVFWRGRFSVQAGVVLYKNNYLKDAKKYLERGVTDLTLTEGHGFHTDTVYYYRGVAKSMTYDKIGACNDLNYARRLGFPVPKRALMHAECRRLDSIDVKRQLESETEPSSY